MANRSHYKLAPQVATCHSHKLIPYVPLTEGMPDSGRIRRMQPI